MPVTKVLIHRAVAALLGAALLAAVAACRQAPPPATPVTFNKDVAPIVFANCAACHRPGEVAPFPLLSYVDAAKHADAMADETLAKRMPPWLPDHGEFPVIGERRLQPDQIDTIQRWVKGGKAEGLPADLPPAPTFPDGWALGKPDVVLTPSRPYTMKPNPDDVYRNIVIRTALPADAFVRAVEFRTNGAPIHHAVIRVDTTDNSRRQDGLDGQPGFDGMTWQGVQDPEGNFIGWAPGRGPIVSPPGMPWVLPHGADLVIELHLIPTDKTASIQPTLALFLSATPPVRTPLTLKMASRMIDIPAGQRDYALTETYQFPVAVDLMSVYPHAHYLGKEMTVSAAFPDGTTKQLLHIPQWSFHWQQDYRYITPIPIPAGTKLTMRYTYDNSDQNADNPHRPPVRVRFGPKSSDEMAELGLQVMPASLADASTLVQSFVDADAQANVTLGEQRVRESPSDAEALAFLGSSYIDVGRFADAVPPLQAALRIKETLAGVHSDLGTALMEQDRLPEALPQFERAVALAPRDEKMYFNLANALSRTPRLNDAAAAYEKALGINGSYAEAQANFGYLLFSHGQVKAALPHLDRAAVLQPNSAVIHTNFSSALAAAGKYPEAMREARRALELNPSYAPAQENVRRLQQMGIK